jgi:hypothetical protein
MSLKKRTLVLLAGLSLAGVALPQKKDAPPTPPHANPPSATTPPAAEPSRQAAPTHVSLADLIGADVLLESGAAEKPSGGAEKPGGGAEKTGGGAEKPAGGRSDAADSPKGKVAELVLSTRDGQIACAALSVGKVLGTNERIVLVPMTAIHFTTVEKRPGYVLRMTRAEVEALPPFDIRKAEMDGLDRAVEQARGLGGGSVGRKSKGAGEDDDAGMGEGLAREAAAGKPAASLSAVPTYVLSGQLKGSALNASDQEFGKVQDAAVEVAGNTVGYLVVSRGGIASSGASLCLVPFRSCQWTRAEEKNALKLGKTIDQLKSAPEYKRPVQGFVTTDQMKSADSFFGSEKGAAPNPQ